MKRTQKKSILLLLTLLPLIGVSQDVFRFKITQYICPRNENGPKGIELFYNDIFIPSGNFQPVTFSANPLKILQISAGTGANDTTVYLINVNRTLNIIDDEYGILVLGTHHLGDYLRSIGLTQVDNNATEIMFIEVPFTFDGNDYLEIQFDVDGNGNFIPVDVFGNDNELPDLAWTGYDSNGTLVSTKGQNVEYNGGVIGSDIEDEKWTNPALRYQVVTKNDRLYGFGEFDFNNFPPLIFDNTPPVITFNPLNNATNVSISVLPIVNFNEPVFHSNGDTITNETVGSLIQFYSTTNVSFVATINETFTQITIQPSEPLEPSTQYTLTLLPVEDSVGFATTSQTIQFTTEVAFTVTATANPQNGGTITGAGNYTPGENVTLIAQPATGYAFVNWTNAEQEIVGTNPTYSFTMPAQNVSLTANFEAIIYSVTAIANPQNAGTITGAGNYTFGQQVTLTAEAATGYAFVNWTNAEQEIVGTNATYSFTMPAQNVSLTANFEAITYSVTAIANPQNAGTITGAGNYTFGQQVTLTAQPATGYAFVNWTNAQQEVVSTQAEYTFPMPAENVSLTANFEAVLYSVTAIANPQNAGTITGTGNYTFGQQVTLTAEAATGYAFVNWTNAEQEIVSTNPTYSFTMPAQNVSLTANFTLQTFDVTFIVRDDAQVGIPDVEIVVTGYSPMLTNQNGTAVQSLPNGDYVFTANKEGYNQITGNFTVANEPLTVEIYMTGINPNVSKNIKLYPNPVSRSLTLERSNDTPETVTIFSNDGKKILSFVVDSAVVNIDTGNLSPGIYWIRFSNSEQISFIKQ